MQTTRYYSAALFDLYGTLAIIPKEAYRAAKARMAKALRCEPTSFEAAWRTLSTASTRGEILLTEDRVVATLSLLGKSATQDEVAKAAAIEVALQEQEVELLPYATECVASVRELGLAMALVTNCSKSAAGVPRSLGLASYFDALVLSFEVGAVKPEPRIYEVACERLKVEANSCIFAGDGDCNELDGASAKGMTSIRVAGTEDTALHLGESANYSHAVHGLRELEQLVVRLVRGATK